MIPVSFCLLLSLLEGMERTLKGALFVQIGLVVEIPYGTLHTTFECLYGCLCASDGSIQILHGHSSRSSIL